MIYIFMSCSECDEGSFDNETFECNHCHTKYRVVVNGARTEEEKKIMEVEMALDNSRSYIFEYEPVKRKSSSG